MVLEEVISEVYTKFKLHFYKNVFEKIKNRETSLTTVELFCVEIIHALGEPTVNEFANYIGVSSPNAAYKIASLLQKGYIEKIQSTTDRREYHLKVTDKFYHYYNLSDEYVKKVCDRAEKRFAPEDVQKLREMMTIISHEMMEEVAIAGAAN